MDIKKVPNIVYFFLKKTLNSVSYDKRLGCRSDLDSYKYLHITARVCLYFSRGYDYLKFNFIVKIIVLYKNIYIFLQGQCSKIWQGKMCCIEEFLIQYIERMEDAFDLYEKPYGFKDLLVRSDRSIFFKCFNYFNKVSRTCEYLDFCIFIAELWFSYKNTKQLILVIGDLSTYSQNLLIRKNYFSKCLM